MVTVRRDRKEYQRTVHHSNGGHVTLTYKKVWQLLFLLIVLMQLTIHVQVKPVNHQLFTKWDDNMHCDTIVAYLEDEKFGYIVREYFNNGMLFSL